MNYDNKQILEWLIEDIDFSKPRELFDNEESKEFETKFEVFALLDLEKTLFEGRFLIRRDNLTTVLFYPLAIQRYLRKYA